MTSTPNNEPTLHDLLDKLRDLSDRLGDVASKVDKLATELEGVTKELSQTQKWNDRTWDVVKWVGGISAGLAISASIALVGIVLKQLL